jgi:uncharacterized protein involved in exopolysaccharide biosynthesis
MNMPQEEIGLAEVWGILYARRALIGAVTAAATVVAIVVALVTPSVFRAQVLLAPVGDDKAPLGVLATQLGGLAELSGIGLAGGTSRDTAIATLQSRTLAEAFIVDRQLMPVLFADEWDDTKRQWRRGAEDAPTLWDAAVLFGSEIRSVQEDRKTGLVTLTIDWRDPRLAADWANDLVRRTNNRLQQEAIAEGQKAVAFLEQQLAKASAIEVRQALYGLIEAETKKVAVAHAREQFAFKVIDPAVEPRKKFKPQRRLIVIAGLLIGLIGSSFVVVVMAATAAQRSKA